MQLNNLSLAFHVMQMNALLSGSFVNKLQEVSNDVFKLKLHSKDGTKNLIITLNSFFVTNYKMEALKLTSGFGAFLRKRIENKKILSIKMHKADRVVLIEFDVYYLILELYAQGNIILTNKEFKIESAFKRKEDKERNIRKEMLYEFPKTIKLNPFELEEKDFLKAIKANEKPIQEALLQEIGVANITAEEALFNAKIGKENKANSLNEKELKKLFKELKELHSLKEEKLAPCITEEKQEILPFKFNSIKAKMQKIVSINDAIDDSEAKQFISEKIQETGKTENKKQLALRKSIEKQKLLQKSFEKEVEENKLKAEAIYKHFTELNEVINVMKKVSLDQGNEKEVMYKLNLLLKNLKNSEIKILSAKKNKLVIEI